MAGSILFLDFGENLDHPNHLSMFTGFYWNTANSSYNLSSSVIKHSKKLDAYAVLQIENGV